MREEFCEMSGAGDRTSGTGEPSEVLEEGCGLSGGLSGVRISSIGLRVSGSTVIFVS